MSAKFDAMAAQRDPLYAATLPQGEFKQARYHDKYFEPEYRDAELLVLTVRALRNQGEPYYTHKEVTP